MNPIPRREDTLDSGFTHQKPVVFAFRLDTMEKVLTDRRCDADGTS